jgi:hypothetical protein
VRGLRLALGLVAGRHAVVVLFQAQVSPDGRWDCAWVQALDPETKRPVGAPRAVRHFHEPQLRSGVGASPTSDVQDGFLYTTLTDTHANVWLIDGKRR